MERLDAYHEHCHQMEFLLGARNRIHNTALCKNIDPESMERIETLTERGWAKICKHSDKLTTELDKLCKSLDLPLVANMCKRLNKFTRVCARFGVVLEEEIIPHKDYPDGWRNRANLDLSTVRHKCEGYIQRLEMMVGYVEAQIQD
jgi:hypothetical protein